MKWPLLLSIFIVLISSACTTLKPVIKMPEKPGSNNVTMLRNWNYVSGGIHFWPTFDDKRVAGLLVQQHVTFIAPLGSHKFGVTCVARLRSDYSDSMLVNVKKDEHLYFLLSVDPLGCAEIEQIDPQEAIRRLTTSSLIHTGNISNCDGIGMPYEKADESACFSTVIPKIQSDPSNP